MAYKFVFSKTAKDDMERLDQSIKKRLKKKLEYFAACDDMSVYAKKLTNVQAGQFRIRVGDYRVIFDMKGSTCIVLRLQHRGDIYRNL